MTPHPKHRPRRKPTRIVSTSGRVRNAHFLLSADHLMLEVDPLGFHLAAAIAEGHVEVHMLGESEDMEYVVLADSGVYQSARQRLVLNGWNGTRVNGETIPPGSFRREVVLPTDGTFFNAPSQPAAGPAMESASLQAA